MKNVKEMTVQIENFHKTKKEFDDNWNQEKQIFMKNYDSYQIIKKEFERTELTHNSITTSINVNNLLTSILIIFI